MTDITNLPDEELKVRFLKTLGWSVEQGGYGDFLLFDPIGIRHYSKASLFKNTFDTEAEVWQAVTVTDAMIFQALDECVKAGWEFENNGVGTMAVAGKNEFFVEEAPSTAFKRAVMIARIMQGEKQ